MRTKKNIFCIILLTVSAMEYAVAVPALAQINTVEVRAEPGIAELVCRHIQHPQKKGFSRGFAEAFKNFEALYFLKLALGQATHLVGASENYNDDVTADSPSLLVHLIEQGTDSKTEFSEQQKAAKESKRKLTLTLRKIHASLLRQTDRESCVELALDTLAKELTLAHEQSVIFQKEMSALSRFLNTRIVKRTQIRGAQVINIKSLVDLHEILRTTLSHHVTIVAHASEEGLLVDQDQNALPENFFDNPSPSIRALFIFSCHAKAVRTRYHLDDLAKTLQVAFVQSEPKAKVKALLGDRVFPEFFKNDYQRFLKISGVPRSSALAACSIRVAWPGNDADYVIELNDFLLGYVTKSATSTAQFNFPCSYLTAGQNHLSVFANGDDFANVAPHEFEIVTEDGQVRKVFLETFFQDEKLISGKVDFISN